jgi:predicted molibdopterin-dependent oxidoreductase YjgC
LPGYRPVSDLQAKATFEAAWKVRLDPNPGRTYEQMVAGVRRKQIKALYLAGEVPPLPELANVAFLVVQDIVQTENMKYAHVVLPGTTFAEMDGTLTNLEGRVKRVRQAIPPLGSSRPGWTVVRDLAERMGAEQLNYRSAADVTAEITSLVPAYANINYKMLNVDGTLRHLQSTTKAQFVPFSLDNIPKLSSAEFPFTLMTERNLLCYHGACLTEQVKGMNLIKKEETLQLNPSDAKRLGIADGALVKVESQYGYVECVAQLIEGMPDGLVFTSINRVVGSPLFPTSTPSAKTCAVRIGPSVLRSEA